ncbi:MAG: hypothetical protein IIY78_07400 [Clostridia bacterium]|nr:hypothetical protein [Clostridia bacterium]
MVEVKINVKTVSGKKNKVTTRSMMFDDNISTVRQLITAAVKNCVDEYIERRETSELFNVLSPVDIENKAQLGKVAFNVNYGEKLPNLQTSVDNALEAFEDGIVVIFADDKKLESLDEFVDIKSTESLTFIKLVMLSGRIW